MSASGVEAPSEVREGIAYQELELLNSNPLLWDANWMNSDETDPLVDMVEKMRSWFPDTSKHDLSGFFAVLMRASRIKYGTIVPALDVISAFLDPTYEVGCDIEFASFGGRVLLELAKALEITRGTGGFIGMDPDSDGRRTYEEEPDDILMGIA